MLLVCCVLRFAEDVLKSVASMKWIIANTALNPANAVQ
jgi:hypothetical protein